MSMARSPTRLFSLLLTFAASLASYDSLEKMLDVMSAFSTGAPFDREYLNELTTCWAKSDPTLLHTQNRMWEGFLNYSALGGAPDGSDPWFPDQGCQRYGQHQPWFESNYSIIGGALNMSVCEPCNMNSNLAFYRTSTRICAKSGWSMSPEMTQAVVRGAALEAAGSAFMHGSETNLGAVFDTHGEIIIPILAHQMAVEKLPEEYRNNSILRDFSMTPQTTGIELTNLLTDTFQRLPASEWAAIIQKTPSDLTKPIGAMVGSLFSLILPPKLVDLFIDLVAKVLHNVIDPTAVNFLKEEFIPLYRKATAHIKLGPIKKLQIARKGVGGFVKFMYSVLWQEQIINARKFTVLVNPWVNKLGAELMPAVNALADLMSGFADSDGVVKHCGDSVYPGAGWCRRDIPHAKWHEMAANAFYDLVSLGDYLADLYASAADGAAVPEPQDLTPQQAEAFEAFVETLQPWVEQQTSLVTLQAEAAAWRAGAELALALLGACLLLVGYLVCKVRGLQRELAGAATIAQADAQLGLLHDSTAYKCAGQV